MSEWASWDESQAGILLAALDFDHAEILRRIHQTFPGIQLIGGTTDGEISSVLEFQQDSVVLILFCSDEIKFNAAVGRHISSDPWRSPKKPSKRLKHRLIIPALCALLPLKVSLPVVF